VPHPPPAPEDATLTLPDGRALGFATLGDPAGRPVLYCHGFPGSRLEPALLAGLAAARTARLIAVDRPGYGLSSPAPGATWLDLAQDHAQLAEHLGLGRVAVVGVSGGGPMALALAQLLGPRVGAVALVNAVPPEAAEFGPWLRRLVRLGQHPRAARLVLRLGRRAVLAAPGFVPPLLHHALPAPDRAVLTPDVLATLLHAWRAGLRPGIAGVRDDAARHAGPLGFALHEITQPVTLWHGGADRVVPPSALAGFAALPRAQTRLLAGETHHAMPIRHAGTILDTLLHLGFQHGAFPPG
jgi:pimeloyl-ACP methyl ester carboxylesterase